MRTYLLQTFVVCCCLAAAILAAGYAHGQSADPARSAAAPQPPDWPALHERAAGILQQALQQEKDWVRVHAAEALLKHGYSEGVEAIYLPEIDTAPPPHRMGVWRVLAQAQTDGGAREEYVTRIRNAFLDVNGADRVHAAETLGKLGDTERPGELVRVAKEERGPLQAYARFALANSHTAEDEAALAELLDGDERGTAAYALRFQPYLLPATVAKLQETLQREPENSDARIYLVSALFVHAPEDVRAALEPVVLRYAREGNKDGKYEAANALGLRGTVADVPMLTQMLDDPEVDVRISASNALLSIESRVRSKEGLALHPYTYREDFEGESPALVQWAKNGTATVAFSGPSEEQAFEGKRSLKLDITINDGTYQYFGVPVRVPCSGNARLSARVLVAEGSTARVGFGTNTVFPRTSHSGCGPVRVFDQPTGRWEWVDADLAGQGESGAAALMPRLTNGVRGEDVGAYVDRWSLFIYGEKGSHAVVYVDDVRIEGETPSEEDYQKELDRRWAVWQARQSKQLDDWRAQLAEARTKLDAIAEPPEQVRADVDAIKARVGEVEQGIQEFSNAGYGSREDSERIEQALFVLKYGAETAAAIADGASKGLPFLLYTLPAISNAQFTPGMASIPSRIAQTLACAGCRGEYEPVTAVVYALNDVNQLLVSVGGLTGPSGSIPSSAVDVSLVKCWYQAGKSIAFKAGQKLLTPELLLKDAALVNVNAATQENSLRSTAADGTQTYIPCSTPTSEQLAGVRPIDAATLQPVDIAAHSLQQFWFTIRIPETAQPGLYKGEVSFTTSNGARSLPVEVTVYPFDLPPPRVTYSIYYRGTLSSDGAPTIGSEAKSEEQYRAEIADMLTHGVAYPTNYQGWSEPQILRALDIRREVGLPTGRFYNLGRCTGSPDTPEAQAALGRDVAFWVDKLRPYGYDQVYFYGIDEATGDQLKAQRDAWRTVQEAGGKTFVACYQKTFEAMGAALNCAVLAGRPDPKEAEKWHSIGSEAFCYAYPQVGEEEPETYRRNFGLVLWKAGFDGAMDYAYQHGFDHVWNDFDNEVYRDHNFTYPTMNGVVDTIQWEGFREAVDDVRYMTTLEDAVKNAPESKADAVNAAKQWMESLDPDTADLYETRARMAEFIEQLR